MKKETMRVIEMTGFATGYAAAMTSFYAEAEYQRQVNAGNNKED